MGLTCFCDSCGRNDSCEGDVCYVKVSVKSQESDGLLHYNRGCLHHLSFQLCNSSNTFTDVHGYVSRYNCCTAGTRCNRELSVLPPPTPEPGGSNQDAPISTEWIVCLIVFAVAVVVVSVLLFGMILEIFYYKRKMVQRRWQCQHSGESLASTDMTLSTQLSSSLFTPMITSSADAKGTCV